ncbi:MAG: universal stress protein [Desulfatibacillaceae bacterium]
MAKKILLAVDESENSSKAVAFVAESMPADSLVTILSVVPEPAAACGLDSPSLVPVFKEHQAAFCSVEDSKRAALKSFAEGAKRRLVAAGFAEEAVSVNLKKKERGVARDILAEAKKGSYDVIVVGRRGLSGIQEFFLGSVSNKVSQMATERTVIVVD